MGYSRFSFQYMPGESGVVIGRNMIKSQDFECGQLISKCTFILCQDVDNLSNVW